MKFAFNKYNENITKPVKYNETCFIFDIMKHELYLHGKNIMKPVRQKQFLAATIMF